MHISFHFKYLSVNLLILTPLDLINLRMVFFNYKTKGFY